MGPVFFLSQLAEELTHRSWGEEARELAALISKPHFKVNDTSILHIFEQ